MLRMLVIAARRGVFASLRLPGRLGAADVLLFFTALMIKLLLFNSMLNVRNMATMPDDILVNVGTLALLAFWTLWLSPRSRTAALAALNLLLTSILYADLVYYRYFQDLLSVPVLLQAGQVDSLGDSIKTLLRLADFIYFADWIIVIPAAIRALLRRRDGAADADDLRSPARPGRRRKLMYRASLGLLVLAAGMTLVFIPVSLAKKTWAAGLFPDPWWNVSLYNVTGLFGYHGYDAYRYVKTNLSGGERSIAADELREAADWFDNRGRARLALQNDPMFGAYKGKNVILVQAEAFQSFVIGRSVGGREITPNLNELLGGSLYYERFYHQTSSGRTADADFAAQCSLHPARSGAVFVRFPSHTFDCTPAALSTAGYSTAAYHAYDGGFWNRNVMYGNMGYDAFHSKRSFELDEPLGWSLGDMSFLRQSAGMIADQRQPFYAFLITLSSHHPYELPKNARSLDVKEFEGTMLGDYLQAAHYADAAVGAFIDDLKRRGLWETTVFLFYGDHDNSVQDWAGYEKLLGKPLSEPERQLMLRQVPLIVHLPDERLKGTRSEPGGQLDLSPTIMHLLGIRTSAETMAGLPLVTAVPVPERSVVFRSGAYTDGRLYFLPSGGGEGGDCYDLAAGAAEDGIAPTEACKTGAAEAREQLRMSDRVVEYDLIPDFRNRND